MRLREGHTRRQFFKDTIAAQIHFIAFLGALTAFVVFALSPSIQGTHFLACATFALLGAFVMGTSAVYHFLSDGCEISPKLASRLEDLDHSAIYLFIAGTYTPFLLNAVHSGWRYPLLILIWVLAVSGIVYTRVKPRLPAWARSRFVSTGLFVLMGWTAMVRIGEIRANLDETPMMLLVQGGLAYTVGAVIYALKKPNFFPGIFGFHELWHVAVVVGFSLHFAMILSFY